MIRKLYKVEIAITVNIVRFYRSIDTKKNTNIYICSYLNKPLRKNMRRNIPTIFSIMTLVALILICACVAQSPADQSSQQNGGLTQITLGSESLTYQFRRQQNKISWSTCRNQPTDTENRKNVNYMLSRDIDESGKCHKLDFRGIREQRDSISRKRHNGLDNNCECNAPYRKDLPRYYCIS